MKGNSVEETDLREYYIVENHSKEETRKYFGLSDWTLSKLFKHYGIRKDSASVRKLRYETSKQRYGLETYNNRSKFKNTVQSRYGGIGFASEECRKKGEKTIEVRYGNSDIRKTEYFKSRAAETKLTRYGDANYNNIQKGKITLKERYGIDNPIFTHIKSSEPERRVREALGGHTYRVCNREFDVKVGNTLIEVDGEFWHPVTTKNLKLTQLRNLVNDYSKEQIAREQGLELIRIHVSDIPDNITLDSVREKNYRPSYSLGYRDYVLTSDTLDKFISNYGKEVLEKDFFPDMLTLIRMCSSSFPEIPKEENLQEVIGCLKNLNYQDYYNTVGCFETVTNGTGSNVLKSRFKSFWNIRNEAGQSPVDTWQSDDKLNVIIQDIVGLNENGVCHGLSLEQIIKGILTQGNSVDFFEPTLAAAIYKKYLGDSLTPVVFDPAAGFGARLLAFKSAYPSGTYIGCETNEETFQELQELVKEAKFSNVVLYSQKPGELPEYDFGFTSLSDFKVANNYRESEDVLWKRLVSLPNMHVLISSQQYESLQDGHLRIFDTIIDNPSLTKSSRETQKYIVDCIN